MLQNLRKNIKGRGVTLRAKLKLITERDIFLVLVLILISLSSFGLGRLSAIRERKTSIQIQEYPFPFKFGDSEKINPSNLNVDNAENIGVVKASINGTKYYYEGCSGLGRIKPENIIEFTSPEEAKLAGYELAANCNP